MLRDISHFTSRLSKLDGFEDTGEYLENIIQSKEVKVAAPPSTPSPAPPVSAPLVATPADAPLPLPARRDTPADEAPEEKAST